MYITVFDISSNYSNKLIKRTGVHGYNSTVTFNQWLPTHVYNHTHSHTHTYTHTCICILGDKSLEY